MKQRKRLARMGRPPRTDNPLRVGVRLPGVLWRWVRARARAEGRTQGDVLASAIALYQARVVRRKGGRP